MNPEAVSAADAIISFHVIDARPCEQRRAVERRRGLGRSTKQQVSQGDQLPPPRLQQGANSISARHLERPQAQVAS